jgi:septation ring formation regulator EzrA
MDNNHTLTDNEIAEVQAVSNTYTLTEDERGQITAIASEIRTLQLEASAVLKSIARARGLNGNWGFDESTFTFKQA